MTTEYSAAYDMRHTADRGANGYQASAKSAPTAPPNDHTPVADRDQTRGAARPITAAGLLRDVDTMSDAEATHILAHIAERADREPTTHPYFPKIARAFLRLVAEETARIEGRTTREQELAGPDGPNQAAAPATPTIPTIPTIPAPPASAVRTTPAPRRETITVAFPDPRAISYVDGYAAHIDAYLLADLVQLLDALTVTLDPLDHDAAEFPRISRLRATIRRYTALIEETLADHDEQPLGAQCRAEVAELDAKRAGASAPMHAQERQRGGTEARDHATATAAAPPAPAVATSA